MSAFDFYENVADLLNLPMKFIIFYIIFLKIRTNIDIRNPKIVWIVNNRQYVLQVVP